VVQTALDGYNSNRYSKLADGVKTMMEGGLHKEAKGLTEISFSHALDGSCTFKLVVSNIVEFVKAGARDPEEVCPSKFDFGLIFVCLGYDRPPSDQGD